MSNDAIEDMAANWFCKRDSGAWTAADQAEFDAWLNERTAHRIAYLRLRAGWKGAERMKALSGGITRGVVPPPGSWGNDRFLGGKNASRMGLESEVLDIHSQPLDGDASATQGAHAPPKSWARARPWTFAATILLTLGLGLYLHEPPFLRQERYATPVGGLDTVPLADGSQVTLNTDTRIRVDLTAKERRVALDQGEAFFDVAKDMTRPFIVQAGTKQVIAVGTKFSVRRDGEDIRVTVTEGHVRIGEPKAKASPLLKAGSIAQTADAKILIREGSAPEAEQLLSWRSGYLVFEATPLADAVAEFNRYNRRKIVIEDPAAAAFRIGGNFRANNIDAFLWLLQSGFPIAIEERPDRIVLTRK